MTRGKPIFNKGAVGVAFLSPEQTGTVHIDVNPETGATIVAEAHTIRLRGSGVQTETLDELGATTTKLISEYLSNYLLNGATSKDRIQVKDETFGTFLGQTVSGLDQMLIETVSSENDHVFAYRMTENKHKIQSPAKNSLLNKITNSLEAFVYYGSGIHLSHRGESQQYLVSKQVRKLTQDHIAGGLFSQIGELGDFIPQIHTQTLKLSRKDRLVVFSREAAVSSFPLNHLRHWLGEGEPKEQAQRVAEELKKLGRSSGCVVVFVPSWQGKPSDDIASTGVFSLNNLANLDSDQEKLIPSITTTTSTETSVSTTYAGLQTKTHELKSPQKKASVSPSSVTPITTKTKSTLNVTFDRPDNEQTIIKKSKGHAEHKPKIKIANIDKASKTKKRAVPVPQNLSADTSVNDHKIEWITNKVIEQLIPRMELFEKGLREQFERKLSALKNDIVDWKKSEVIRLQAETETVLKQFLSHPTLPPPPPIPETSRLVSSEIPVHETSTMQVLTPVQPSRDSFLVRLNFLKNWRLLRRKWRILTVTSISMFTLACILLPEALLGVRAPESSPSIRSDVNRENSKKSSIEIKSQPDDEKSNATMSSRDMPSPKERNPVENLTEVEMYEKGMALYIMGDLGRDPNRGRLNRLERQNALRSALPYFESIVDQTSTLPNAWYLKGRTEYNLAKLEADHSRQKQFAVSALSSYEQYMKSDRQISKAKQKTISRNQKRLKNMLR